jgi:hypothetical protein
MRFKIDYPNSLVEEINNPDLLYYKDENNLKSDDD